MQNIVTARRTAHCGRRVADGQGRFRVRDGDVTVDAETADGWWLGTGESLPSSKTVRRHGSTT